MELSKEDLGLPRRAEKTFEGAAPRARRVGIARGWVVHGFCFEFSDGKRVGSFLDDDKTEMKLDDDEGLKRRWVRWETLDLDAGEHIVTVSGANSTFGFLAAKLGFVTNRGNSFTCAGENKKKNAEGFEWVVTTGYEVSNVLFKDGKCIGIDKISSPDVTDNAIDQRCSLVSDGLALSSRDAASVTSTDLERLDAAPGRNIVSPEAAAPPLRDCRDRSRSPNGESETPEERSLRARTSLGHKVEWSTYIKPFAESLNKLFIEDWKVTKKWDFKCVLCPKAGKAGIHVDLHIRGDPHRRMLLKERKCDQPTWLQSFELISGCHKFHHLTGELTLGAVTTLEPSSKMPKDEGSKRCVGEASTESAKRSKIDETSCAIEEPSDLCVAVKDAKAKYKNKKVQDAIQDAKVKEYLSEEFVARLPNPGEVPPFDPFARGGPLNWNKQQQLYWGKRTKEYLSRIPTLTSDIAESHVRVRELLHERFGPDGRPIFEQLVYDTHDKTGWYRYRWAPFEDAGGKEALPKSSLGKHGHQGQADWQRAWHGCKFEALYSIMYHGRLFESGDAERGERFFSNAPGVYVHKDETCAKTGNYFRFVPLCRDGVFWAALWEVQVDRSDRVPPKNGTDQWVQHERSVKLAALWLIGCTYEHMHSGCAVSLAWDPFLEADPKRDRTRRRKRSVEAKNPQISNALEDALGIPPAGTCSINKLGTD